jgi:hypothetical protein
MFDYVGGFTCLGSREQDLEKVQLLSEGAEDIFSSIIYGNSALGLESSGLGNQIRFYFILFP